MIGHILQLSPDPWVKAAGSKQTEFARLAHINWLIDQINGLPVGGGVTSINTLVGAVTFAAGTNITLTPVGNTITIDATPGVTSINTLLGAVVLAAGTNITLTPVGNTITIDSTAGSEDLAGTLVIGNFTGGNDIILTSGDVITVTDSGRVSTLDLGGANYARLSFDNGAGGAAQRDGKFEVLTTSSNVQHNKKITFDSLQYNITNITTDSYLYVDATGFIVAGAAPIDGSGTLNFIPKFTPDGNTLGDSIIYEDGAVGINTVDFTTGIGGLVSKLAVRGSNGDFGYHTLGLFENTLNPTVNNGNYNRGLTSSVIKLGAFNTGQIVASFNGADDQGSGNITDMYSAYNYVLSRGTGTLTNVIANYSDKQVQSGTITLLASFVADTTQLSGGTVTNMIGLYVKVPTNVSGGTRTNTYGVLVESNTTGTNNYGFVSAGNMSNGLGTLSPSAQALLELVSTDKAFLIMRMTAAQASAITPADGMGLYVTTTDATFTTVGFWKYEAGVWLAW